MLRLLLRIPVPWVFVLTYLIGVALEQGKLREAFGEEYARYQAGVRRWL